ncbi:tyrosine-type recombinase/integrase [Pseudobutyrivibrio sp.]
MKSVKLKSGSYRVQKQVNGQRLSMTFDHKPTKKEIEDEIAHRLGYYNGKLTFEAAANNYIDARTNILSPSTIKNYRLMIKYFTIGFLNKPIDDIQNNEVQREINNFGKNVSPKTVKNRYALVSSVFAEFRPDYKLDVNLPMQVTKKPYSPKSDEVRMLLDEAEGTKFKTALLLACCSMRRGEICALTMDDVDIQNKIIHVNKDIVISETNEWVIKVPKTEASIRDINVPSEVIDSIIENGLFTGHPNQISKWMRRHQDKLGLPHFSLHKLRHFFVSTAHEKGISDAKIMAAGGWANPNVMIKHYRHAQDAETVTTTVLEDLF